MALLMHLCTGRACLHLKVALVTHYGGDLDLVNLVEATVWTLILVEEQLNFTEIY